MDFWGRNSIWIPITEIVVGFTSPWSNMHSMWVITIYFVHSVHQEIKRFFASHHLLQDRFRPYKERTLKLSNGGMPCEMAYERKSRSLLYTCLTTPESVEMYSWLLSTIWTLEISVQIEPAELEEPKKRLISIPLAQSWSHFSFFPILILLNFTLVNRYGYYEIQN